MSLSLSGKPITHKTLNFQVSWEEVGYPQHNGTMNNVTSTTEFIINLGTPFNPSPAQASYRIKISDGNGSFDSHL
jgi:hypothetical protein